jgi:protein TonB
MAKDINITSQQWNDIIFDGKNKDYGAYEMRQSSSKRHLIAFLFIIILVIVVAVLPALIDKFWIQRVENISTDVVFTDLRQIEEIDKLDEITVLNPSFPLMSTIAFATPDIVDKSEIDNENKLKTQNELEKSELQISIATIEGDADRKGIDIAELGTDLNEYLLKNIIYPQQAREAGIEGRVIVNFIINKNGSISDIAITRSPSKILSNEVIRVVKEMPKWIPIKQNGEVVNIDFTLPVVFLLENM